MFASIAIGLMNSIYSAKKKQLSYEDIAPRTSILPWARMLSNVSYSPKCKYCGNSHYVNNQCYSCGANKG